MNYLYMLKRIFEYNYEFELKLLDSTLRRTVAPPWLLKIDIDSEDSYILADINLFEFE